MDGLQPESHHLIGMTTEAPNFQPEAFSPPGQTNNDVQFPIFEKLMSSHLHNTQIANELPASYKNGFRPQSHQKFERPNEPSDFKPEKFSPHIQANTNLQFPIFEKLMSSHLHNTQIANEPPASYNNGFQPQSHHKFGRPTESSDFNPETSSPHTQPNASLQFPIFEKLMSSQLENIDIANRLKEFEKDRFRSQSHHKFERPTQPSDYKPEKSSPVIQTNTNLQFPIIEKLMSSQLHNDQNANEPPASYSNGFPQQSHHNLGRPTEPSDVKPEKLYPHLQANANLQFPILEKLMSSHLHNTQITNEPPASFNNGFRPQSHNKFGRLTEHSGYKPEALSPHIQTNASLQFPIFEKSMSSQLENIHIANQLKELEKNRFRSQSHHKFGRPTQSSDFEPETFSPHVQTHTNLQFPILEKLMSSQLENIDIANQLPESEKDRFGPQSHHKLWRPAESSDFKPETFSPYIQTNANLQFLTFEEMQFSQPYKNEQANELEKSDKNGFSFQFHDEFEVPNENLNIEPDILSNQDMKMDSLSQELQVFLDSLPPSTTTDTLLPLYEPYNQYANREYGPAFDPVDVESEENGHPQEDLALIMPESPWYGQFQWLNS
ncbi:hypothetical protein ACOME3_005315 [Neoechinorhynchus agilis]